MKSNMEKAVIYARVSSKEQEREGFSIPAQIRHLEDYASKNKIKILKVFQEAETAKKVGRKEFVNMIKYLNDNPSVKTVLVEKTDRLYRSFSDYEILDYKKMGISIHFVKEGTILSKKSHSSHKLFQNIRVALAEGYLENLSEEVIKGHEEKLLQGGWPGEAPIGYLNKLEDHSIAIDPKLSPIIVRTFELAKTGNYSLSRLKKEVCKLGLRGRRSDKELSKSQMQRLLQNPFYYGVMRRAGKMYNGNHYPIISKSLFDQVQEVMGYVKKPSLSKYDFVYRGPLVCGSCGCRITAELKRKKTGREYIYYHCTDGKGICKDKRYVIESRIEELYTEALRSIKLSEEIIELTRTILLSSHNQEQEMRKAQLSQLNSRYKKLESYISKCYEDKLEGTIELDLWTSKTEAWELEKLDISEQLHSLNTSNKEYMLEGIRLMDIANKAAELFQLMTVGEKRELINLVLSNPVLTGTNIRYDYKKPFDLFVHVTDLESWRERRDSNPRPSA